MSNFTDSDVVTYEVASISGLSELRNQFSPNNTQVVRGGCVSIWVKSVKIGHEDC